MYNQTVCKEQDNGFGWLDLLLVLVAGFFIGRHTAQIHIMPAVMSAWLGLTFCMLKVILLSLAGIIGFLMFLGCFFEMCKDGYVWDGLELLLVVLPLSVLGALPMAGLIWCVM